MSFSTAALGRTIDHSGIEPEPSDISRMSREPSERSLVEQ